MHKQHDFQMCSCVYTMAKPAKEKENKWEGIKPKSLGEHARIHAIKLFQGNFSHERVNPSKES